MQPELRSCLRWIAISVAVACVWFDFQLREAPRPQLAGFEWRRTIDGWEERPRWQAPPSETLPRPLLLASALFGVSAAALSWQSPARPAERPTAPAGSLALE